MKRKKILFILPSFAAGGAEKVILSLFANIDSNKFQPILIIQNNKGPLKINNSKNKIIYLNNLRFRYAISKLFFLIKELNPNIIVSTFPHISLFLLFFKKFFLKNLLIVIRIPNMLDKSKKNFIFKLYNYIQSRFLPLSDRIIVTSESMKNTFINKGISNNKCSLIRNPIDSTKIRNIKNYIRYPGKGIRLVFVGRLVYQKGLDRIIPIIKNIKDCHLTIIGEGPEKLYLETMVSKYNIEKKINFVGYSDNTEAYVAAADYFILPSRWEGLPNSALESLILGTPVITFKEITGLKDLESKTPSNKLFFCSDEEDMQNLILGLRERKDYLAPKLRNILLDNFHTPKSYAKEIEKIFQDLNIEK